MKKSIFIAVSIVLVLGFTVALSQLRTAYGHGQGAFLGASVAVSPEAESYFSEMLPQLVEYAKSLGLRVATTEEVKAMKGNLPVAIPSESILTEANGIVLTERGERVAFSFWPSMNRSIDPDLQLNGFGVFYHYFEACWSWQKGRLEAPTMARITQLNNWVAAYTAANPPNFDVQVSAGNWLGRND